MSTETELTPHRAAYLLLPLLGSGRLRGTERDALRVLVGEQGVRFVDATAPVLGLQDRPDAPVTVGWRDWRGDAVEDATWD